MKHEKRVDRLVKRAQPYGGCFVVEVVRSSPLTYRRCDTGEILTPTDFAHLHSRYPEATFIVDDIA